MKTSNGWALVDITPFLALLAMAGTWIASGELDGRLGESAACETSNLAAGVKTPHYRYRFTEDDITPFVAAMANQGLGTFIAWMDPNTGAIDVVGEFDHKPHLDIKPGSCPNPLNVSHGAAAAAAVLPTSLLGNAFDVTQIDITTVRISPVILQVAGDEVQLPPVHISYEDVGEPFEGGGSCGCMAGGPDGILDLVIHFDRQSMIDAFDLESQTNNSFFPLKVTGLAKEGRAIFAARDCIRILNH